MDSRFIGWRQEVRNAQPDEGSLAECSHEAFLATPTGTLLRDTAKEEIQQNWEDVSKAKVKEITGLYDLGCFKRWPRHKSNNIIDARWVIIWKLIEGSVGVECRLTVRGFKDTFQDLDAYVGTTGRSGQRLANAVAAGNNDLFFFSLDVSQAFAKGLRFEKLSALIDQQVRKVEFDVPRADIHSLR